MRHTGTIEIQTERLHLRPFAVADVQQVYDNYGCDPLVNRYISFAPCAELESAKGFIDMHLEQYQNNPEFYGWAITLDDEVIGSIGMFNVDSDAYQAELGYSVGSKWWGKGIASEAAKAVARHAIENVGIHRLYASCHSENTASERILKKIGMQYEGTMRDGQRNTDGTYSNLKLYALLEQDWRDSHDN